MNKEELVFNIYKEKVIKNKSVKEEFKKKFGFDNRTSQDLIARIINYQIKKYGIRKPSDVEYLSTEECKRRGKNARRRKGERIHHWKKAQADSERVGKNEKTNKG